MRGEMRDYVVSYICGLMTIVIFIISILLPSIRLTRSGFGRIFMMLFLIILSLMIPICVLWK